MFRCTIICFIRQVCLIRNLSTIDSYLVILSCTIRTCCRCYRNGLLASVVSGAYCYSRYSRFLTSASDTFTVKSLPFASVVTYLPSPTMLNVSSLRFTTPADVLVSPENFKLTASVVALAVSDTAFNRSSVAARPVVAVPFHVVLIDQSHDCYLRQQLRHQSLHS